MTCKRKHTVFQPKGRQWACPECEALDEKGLEIVDDDGAYTDCPLLHTDDIFECNTCGESFYGYELVVSVQKRLNQNQVKCPHCNGKGYVDK